MWHCQSRRVAGSRGGGADERQAGASRAGRRGAVQPRPGRAGGAAAFDHRPRPRASADRQRGWQRRRRPERRDLQLPGVEAGASGQRPPLRHRLRHRGPRAPLRGARRGVRRAAAGDVCGGALGRARAAPAAGPGPLRDQAALLPPRRRRALVRLGAEGVARTARLLACDRSAGGLRLPGVQLGPGAADDLRRSTQAAAGVPALLAERGDRAAPLRASGSSCRRPGAERAGGCACGGATRGAEGLDSRPPRR